MKLETSIALSIAQRSTSVRKNRRRYRRRKGQSARRQRTHEVRKNFHAMTGD